MLLGPDRTVSRANEFSFGISANGCSRRCPSGYDRPDLRLVVRTTHLNEGAFGLYVPDDPRHSHEWGHFLVVQPSGGQLDDVQALRPMPVK